MKFVVFLIAFIGVASPFAVGTTAEAGAKTTPRSSLFQSHSPLSTHLAHTGASAAVATSERQSKSSIRNFISNLNPSGGKKHDRWKGGESKATLASRLVFSYISPLLDLASERKLDTGDALEVAEHLKMDQSVDNLARIYDDVNRKAQRRIEEQKAKATEGSDNNGVKNSRSLLLLKALVISQRSNLMVTAVQRLCNTAVQAFPALLLSRLLRLIEAGSEYPTSKSIVTALTLASVLCLKMIIENQFFHNVVNLSTQTRGALEGMIFDKSLRLPGGGSGVLSKKESGGKKETEKKALGSGGVLNLMQSDATIIESAAMQVHTIWDGPLQIVLYTSLLFKYLGPSVLWGLAVLLTVIPLNSVTLRILDRMSRLEMEAKEARTKRTTESITNMKLLKLQAWEKRFAQDIRVNRAEEIQRHRTRGIVRALNSAVSNAVPALVLVVTLTAYVKSGKPIVASTIFTAISLFNQLRFPLFFLPMLIDSLANGRNALRRISSYLSSEEITPYVEVRPPNEGGSIEMTNGNFLWSSSRAPSRDGEVAPPVAPALCNANLKIGPGEVVAVVGPVGSGKSALVKGLLGELAPVPRVVVDSQIASGEIVTDHYLDKPTVVAHGNSAYCSQEAWLPKGTIRDAILFGRDYDDARYSAAIYDAGLDTDIANNVLSHETDVGERGSGLSGGQRARVALARALYSGGDAKVYLLDDCLAALDASVGSMVFERVTERLRNAKAATVIVTNDPSLPRRCDRVVLMGPTNPDSSSSSCSTIVDIGTYDELLARGHKLQSYFAEDAEEQDGVSIGYNPSDAEYLNGQSNPDTTDEGESLAMKHPQTIRVAGGYECLTNATDHSRHAEPERVSGMQDSPNYISHHVVPVTPELEIDGIQPSELSSDKAAPKDPSTDRAKLISTDDNMSLEAVPLKTYVSYLKAVRSPKLIGTMLAAYVVTNFVQMFQSYTVAKWTELGRGDAMAVALGGRYLRTLVYSAGAVSVFLWIRSYLTMLFGARASEFYHERMLTSVFRAPMSFFDATPSGQILSRFGKEIEVIDRNLPDSLASVLFCALQIVSSAASLAGAITPAMMVPVLFVGLLYSKTMARFRPAARDMKRTETKTRSPIFTHFGEALRGTEVIRSIPGADRTWSRRHRALSDTNLKVFSTVKALDRWLSCNLEVFGNFMVFVSAIASVLLARAGKLKPGFAGWGITNALAITGLMAWAVRNLTYLETHMMSVQRVTELTDIDSDETSGIPRMARELDAPGQALQSKFLNAGNDKLDVSLAPVNEAALVADGWPWMGGVRFRDVSMRYNPSSPLVLKKVSLLIPPGTTLGVVGRTGSGKSSLLLTLFRIIEIENGGSIEIDGVDIRAVSIQTLREKLSIIPQDPVLFTGTIAYNLDATGKTSAEEMWQALEAMSPELAAQFRQSGKGLETPINEGGGNMSLGQRQLICLARALLRKSKILVLDEATSSVDSGTDQQVQATIRTQFVDKGVTVITVAHRLDTVLGYDKITVLGDGEVLEFGSPSDLLQNQNGELRRLLDADRLNKKKGGIARQSASLVVG